MGALSITGLAAIKAPFEPLVPGAVHVTNTNRFRSPFPPEVTADDDRFAAAADVIEEAIVSEAPDTVWRGVPRTGPEHGWMLPAPARGSCPSCA